MTKNNVKVYAKVAMTFAEDGQSEILSMDGSGALYVPPTESPSWTEEEVQDAVFVHDFTPYETASQSVQLKPITDREGEVWHGVRITRLDDQRQNPRDEYYMFHMEPSQSGVPGWVTFKRIPNPHPQEGWESGPQWENAPMLSVSEGSVFIGPEMRQVKVGRMRDPQGLENFLIRDVISPAMRTNSIMDKAQQDQFTTLLDHARVMQVYSPQPFQAIPDSHS